MVSVYTTDGDKDMADYATFCARYGHDPRTAEARAEYDEYRRTLIDMHAAAMKGGSKG